MKKILVLAIAATMTMTALCSCSLNISPAQNGSSNGENSLQSSTVADSSEQSSADDSSAVDSSDNDSSSVGGSSKTDALFSWKIKLDGQDYTLPCDFSDFKDNGWDFESDKSEETLGANYYTIAHLKKGDMSLDIDLWNPTESKLAYADCKVGSISVSFDDNVSLELSDGFVFDDKVTSEDIIERYGNPKDSGGMLIDEEDYVALNYEYEPWKSVEFMIYKEDNMKKYSDIEIQNMD